MYRLATDAFIFRVLACSFYSSWKTRDLQAAWPRRSPLVQTQGVYLKTQTLELTFKIPLQADKKCKCSGNWLLSTQICSDNCFAHRHQTVRSCSFIPAHTGVLVFVHCITALHYWKIILAALSSGSKLNVWIPWLHVQFNLCKKNHCLKSIQMVLLDM